MQKKRLPEETPNKRETKTIQKEYQRPENQKYFFCAFPAKKILPFGSIVLHFFYAVMSNIHSPNNELVVIQASELSSIIADLLDKQANSLITVFLQHHSPKPETRYITRGEAAAHLKIGLGTINRRMKDGSLPFKKIGRRVLIDRNALEAQS